MMTTFLLSQKLQEHFDEETDFDFRSRKWGPVDPCVDSTLIELRKKGRITVAPKAEHNGEFDRDEYALTQIGTREAHRLYERLPDGQQDLLQWIKSNHAVRPMGSLLSFIYMLYPGMMDESASE